MWTFNHIYYSQPDYFWTRNWAFADYSFEHLPLRSQSRNFNSQPQYFSVFWKIASVKTPKNFKNNYLKKQTNKKTLLSVGMQEKRVLGKLFSRAPLQATSRVFRNAEVSFSSFLTWSSKFFKTFLNSQKTWSSADQMLLSPEVPYSLLFWIIVFHED